MRLPPATVPTAFLASCVLLLVGCSSGGDGPKPYVLGGSISTLNATVQSIDPQTRQVTLKEDTGESVTFVVDDRVENLDKVKVGDRVKAAYVESVEIQVRDPDEPGGTAAPVATTADWQKGPDGSYTREATLTAVVKRVDRKKGTVDLKGPGGKVRPFRVRDPRNLENVRVGDEVIATHREAMAVAIDPVGPGTGPSTQP